MFMGEFSTESNPDVIVKNKLIKNGLIWISILISLVLVFGYFLLQWLHTPPTTFPVGQVFEVTRGESYKAVALNLEDQGYIRSYVYFMLRQQLRTEPIVLKASKYKFDEPLSLSELEQILSKGDFRHDLVNLVFTEGSTIKQLASLAEETLTNFDRDVFISLTKDREGNLFPDTYLVPNDYSEEELFNLLTKTQDEKLAPYENDFINSHLTKYEVLILASILEREANNEESMKMIAGILLNRLQINMPLQADASIEYILEKPLQQLNPEDLKMDSPYNTYTNYGLPPTPICNPGLVAILAVLKPTKSDYLFYITDSEGVFHYAKNFDQHRVNIAKYLR